MDFDWVGCVGCSSNSITGDIKKLDIELNVGHFTVRDWGVLFRCIENSERGRLRLSFFKVD